MELLHEVTELWTKQIEVCKQAKRSQFGETAERLWGFLGKSYRDLDIEAEGLGDEMPDDMGPMVRTRINLTREFVSLMLPYVHEKLPTRTVRSRIPPLPPELMMFAPESGPKPEDMLRAYLLEYWLNYLPSEYDLYREARTAIQEALVKGRGVCWCEMIEGPYGRIPAHFFDSVDGLLIDADCRQMRDAGFIMRERVRSVWRVAEDFGIDPDKLRGAYQSHLSQAMAARWQPHYATGESARDKDVCVYYEVWSRMGIGQNLKGASEEVKALGAALETTGPHVWLAIMPGIPYPLNLGDEEAMASMSEDEIRARIEWPIAFYEEAANPWPCSPLDIYPNPDNPWATSPLESCLPLQIFIDRVYTYIMHRVRAASRNITVVAKELSADIKEAVHSGFDQQIIEYNGSPRSLEELIHVIEFNPLTDEIWNILQAVEKKFERASGMDPLLYGAQPETQIRSSYESQVREERMTSRPNDYADAVLNWMSMIARKEGQASRMYVEPATVAPLFGEVWQPPPESSEDVPAPPPDPAKMMAQSPLTYYWSVLVNTDDPAVAAGEVEYVCESGHGERRNKQKLQKDAEMLGQTLLPVAIQERGQTGDPSMFNALMAIIGEAFDIPKLAQLQLQPLMPEPPTMPGEEAPPEEEPVSG